MSNRQESEVRTIHPRALRELGEEACIVALGVARDLRSGVIPPAEYAQHQWCGSSCCIAGHIATRIGVAERNQAHRMRVGAWANKKMYASGKETPLIQLFGQRHPSDTLLAADAIERYVYDGSEEPWSA